MNFDSVAVLKKNESLYSAYPPELSNLRKFIQKEIREVLGIPADKALILNGHQIIFYHPGIISKEITSHRIAKSINGASVSILLDHDFRDIYFTSPVVFEEAGRLRIRKKNFLLAPQSKIQEQLSTQNTSLWQDFISEIKENLSVYYPVGSQNFLLRNLGILQKNIFKSSNIEEYITKSRQESLAQEGISFLPLSVSRISSLIGWKEFCKLVTAAPDKFRLAHNEALKNYRNLHHIKNHAQPVPDLKASELPFWNNVTGTRQKATLEDSAKVLLPRAITLSIFLRLFVADIFIHGTGGARYDQVTNSIIRQYFNVIPSDFIVKTATLALPLTHIQDFEHYKNLKSLGQWHNDMRDFKFHPEKILGKDHPLSVERKKLIQQFFATDKSQKALHNKLELNRHNMLDILKDYEKKMQEEKKQISHFESDQSALLDRTLPYFFYDITQLMAKDDFQFSQF